MRGIITKVARYRHPGALFPLLCQSVADRINPDIVEDLEEYPVFTEDGQTFVYSVNRTPLWCAEEHERNQLYGWDNVDFYIVPNLEANFGCGMLIPLEYYWGGDDAGSGGEQRTDEPGPSGKKKADKTRSSRKKKADEPQPSGKKKADEPRSSGKRTR